MLNVRKSGNYSVSNAPKFNQPWGVDHAGPIQAVRHQDYSKQNHNKGSGANAPITSLMDTVYMYGQDRYPPKPPGRIPSGSMMQFPGRKPDQYSETFNLQNFGPNCGLNCQGKIWVGGPTSDPGNPNSGGGEADLSKNPEYDFGTTYQYIPLLYEYSHKAKDPYNGPIQLNYPDFQIGKEIERETLKETMRKNLQTIGKISSIVPTQVITTKELNMEHDGSGGDSDATNIVSAEIQQRLIPSVINPITNRRRAENSTRNSVTEEDIYLKNQQAHINKFNNRSSTRILSGPSREHSTSTRLTESPTTLRIASIPTPKRRPGYYMSQPNPTGTYNNRRNYDSKYLSKLEKLNPNLNIFK
jgi:hypothetical protein